MTPHSSHRTSKDTQDTLLIQGDTTTAVIKEDTPSLEASMITCTPQMQEHQKKRKRKSLKKSAHKSWRDWLVRLGTSARVLSFLALLMVLSMWSESVEYSKSNNLLQGSIASIDMSVDATRTE